MSEPIPANQLAIESPVCCKCGGAMGLSTYERRAEYRCPSCGYHRDAKDQQQKKKGTKRSKPEPENGPVIDLYSLQQREPEPDPAPAAAAAAAAPKPADKPMEDIKVKEEKKQDSGAAAAPPASAAEAKTKAQMLLDWTVDGWDFDNASKEVLVEILNAMLEDLDGPGNKNDGGDDDDTIDELSDWFDAAFEEYDFYYFNRRNSEFEESDIQDAGHDIVSQLVDALKERKILHVPCSSFVVRDALINELGVPLDAQESDSDDDEDDEEQPAEQPAAKRVKRSPTPVFKDSDVKAEDIPPAPKDKDGDADMKEAQPKPSAAKGWTSAYREFTTKVNGDTTVRTHNNPAGGKPLSEMVSTPTEFVAEVDGKVVLRVRRFQTYSIGGTTYCMKCHAICGEREVSGSCPKCR